MDFHFISIIYLQLLPCLFALCLIAVLWRKRHVAGVIYLILFECASVFWAIADTIVYVNHHVDVKLIWSGLGILGASCVPSLFLLFTLDYFHIEKFPLSKIIGFLLIVPILTFGLTITNQYHFLIWDKLEMSDNNELIYHYGKWFWFYIFYQFGISVLALIILLSSILKFYQVYKGQIFYLIMAIILPFTACILYIFKLTPFNADLTSFTLIFAGIFISMGIYRHGMLEIIPIARKQIIENISDGILVIDIAERIVDANPVIRELIKKDQKQLLGKSFETVKEMLLPYSYNCSDTGSVLETTINSKKGRQQFEVKCNPVKLNNGVLVGKIFIFHDITQRKEAFDLAVESNHLLRKEMGEKEKLITDLDAYARTVAHDLKNPIAGLIGIRDITREYIMKQKNDEAAEILELAYKQCIKMNRIVDELLLLSRIRKEDVKLVAVDMPGIITESIKRFNGRISNVDFKIEMPDFWPEVQGHPQWIEEVWFNLISNALKYGGNPPAIRIGYDDLGTVYRFWIQDNGDGLPRHSLDKLFRDFERLEHKNREGHGLGLSIIKRIIEKLDGEVQVTSENSPGKGCIFSFTLKAKQKI